MKIHWFYFVNACYKLYYSEHFIHVLCMFKFFVDLMFDQNVI